MSVAPLNVAMQRIASTLDCKDVAGLFGQLRGAASRELSSAAQGVVVGALTAIQLKGMDHGSLQELSDASRRAAGEFSIVGSGGPANTLNAIANALRSA